MQILFQTQEAIHQKLIYKLVIVSAKYFFFKNITYLLLLYLFSFSYTLFEI